MRLFSRSRDEQQEEDHISKQAEEQQTSAGTRPDSSPMGEVITDIPSGLLIDGTETPPRVKVVVHRLDGGLEEGESESRVIKGEGFLIYSPADPTRARVVPTRDIKYVVFGSVDDPALEPDPGDSTTARKAVLRFRDGEWIAAYIAQGAQPDGDGIAIKIRLTELQRVIPAVAAFPSLLETQYVEMWTAPGTVAGPPAGTPRRRRSDILEAAASQGRDLTKLANDFRDRLALIRDVGLTTGDTLAFSRAVRTHLDRFLADDGINLTSQEKSALADIILRAAVGYGPLDSLLHDRSVSEIMVNGPDQVFIERRGVLTKADVRFEDENQLLETIRRMVATTGRHIDGLNPMVDARLPDGSRVNAIIRPAAIHGPALTIRKFKDAVLGIEDLKHEGSLSPAMAEFLSAAVLGRMNILVSGGTGSGKTTTLNVIARFIPHNQRVITIEDAAELQIDHPHVIALEHRPANVEGKGELTIRQPDGRRKVAQIAEVVGYASNGPILRDIFLLGMGPDLRLEYNATGYVPTALDKAAFYGVQVDQDLFDPVKSRFIPAGSDSMMPVVKDPLMSGQGKSENVTNRTVVVVPFSSDRPVAAASQSAAHAAAQAAAPAQTPEMQEEMRKLIDAARAAVADLQAATPTQPVEAPPALPPQPVAPVVYPTGAPAPPYPYPEQTTPPPVYAQPPPGYNPLQDVHAHQALEAATAMARATTALGQLAAASSGFSGMLPTVHATEGAPGPAGASRRIQAVIESIITRRGLSLRLAPALTQAFEGAELKASDYAHAVKGSKDSAGRELRLAVESGLLQTVRYPQ